MRLVYIGASKWQPFQSMLPVSLCSEVIRLVDGAMLVMAPAFNSASRKFHYFRGCSSAGRAPDLHSGGRRFDPDQLHQFRSAGPVAQLVRAHP